MIRYNECLENSSLVTHEMTKIEGNAKIGNKLGRLGEDIACKFLEEKKFKIVNRNFRKKLGEIDIIATKNNQLHFIEVKSVSCEILQYNVTHETFDDYRAENNVHRQKILRLKHAIQIYFEYKKISHETDWIFDIITVKIDVRTQKTSIHFIKDIIL